MIKLHHDKAQIEKLLKNNPLGVHKVKVMQDWLAMFEELEHLEGCHTQLLESQMQVTEKEAELSRLQKALDMAVADMKSDIFEHEKTYKIYEDMAHHQIALGIDRALDILRRHFGIKE